MTKRAVVDTSIVLALHYGEKTSNLIATVLRRLKEYGYTINYTAPVYAEVKEHGKEAVSILNAIASRLRLYNWASFVAGVEKSIAHHRSWCNGISPQPPCCRVDRGDIAISLSVPDKAILVTMDRGQACFHVKRGGKVLLLPFTL